MTALTNQCPCARKMRIAEVPDPSDPPPYPADTNTVCIFCERVLRNTVAGNRPDHASFQDELAPGEEGLIIAARARAGLVRGRPIDNPPVRQPEPRP